MRKLIAFSIFSLLFYFSGHAQIKKVLHKTYPIDSVENIKMDIVGEYEVLTWAGSAVLTETSIELYDANLNIFKHFLKEGRYDVDLTINGSSASFDSHDKVRKDIKTSKGQCWEIIKLRIFVPEEFTIIDPTRMVKTNATVNVEKSTN